MISSNLNTKKNCKHKKIKKAFLKIKTWCNCLVRHPRKRNILTGHPRLQKQDNASGWQGKHKGHRKATRKVGFKKERSNHATM